MVDEDIEVRRGRGRPRKEEVYEYMVKVRLSEEQWDLLRDCEEELDMSKSEIMRKALETYHNIKLRWR